MQLESYKIIFITIALIGILLFASPTIGLLIGYPTGEKYSEIYILGMDGLLNNVPLQIKVGSVYNIYVGVGNYLGSSNYYTYYVKLANSTDVFTSTLKTPSSLPILYSSNIFLTDKESIVHPLFFEISDVSFLNDRVIINSIKINEQELTINSEAVWNPNLKGFYYYMFFELWRFNGEETEFDNRLVYFSINVTI